MWKLLREYFCGGLITTGSMWQIKLAVYQLLGAHKYGQSYHIALRIFVQHKSAKNLLLSDGELLREVTAMGNVPM